MSKKLLLSLLLMPVGWYVVYGPPLRNIVRSKFRESWAASCRKNRPEQELPFCLRLGDAVLERCSKYIHVASLRTKFPECQQRNIQWFNRCTKQTAAEVCVVEIERNTAAGSAVDGQKQKSSPASSSGKKSKQ